MKSRLLTLFAIATSILGNASCASVRTSPAKPVSHEAGLVHLGDIERKDDGSIRYLNQDEAIDFCAHKGGHLPTMREYAELATATQGARGIRETAFKDVVYNDPRVIAEREKNGEDGYLVIYKETTPGRLVVDLYFNKTGYQKQPGANGTFWFWTSTQVPMESGLAIAFDGPAGLIHYGFYHYNYYPVRCSVGT